MTPRESEYNDWIIKVTVWGGDIENRLVRYRQKKRTRKPLKRGTRMITAPSIENHLTAGSQTLSFVFQNEVVIQKIGLWDTDKKKTLKKIYFYRKKQKFDQRTQRDHGDKWTLITCIAATIIRSNGSHVNMHLACYNWKNMCYNSFSKRNIGRLKTTTMEWRLHQKLSTLIKIICPLINVKLMLYFWTWH